MRSKLCLPDYNGKSLVNLMSSIGRAFGHKSKHKTLNDLKPCELCGYQNIVLLVIDGLGYEYLRKHGKGSIFSKYLKSPITSVFPATTATCVTTFYTGLSPQEHAVTGWFVYLKEVDAVSTILRFEQRGSRTPLEKRISPKKIFDQKSFFSKIAANSYVVISNKFVNSQYNITSTTKAVKIGSNSYRDHLENTKNIILSRSGRKFIYTYWPRFDELCHRYGVKSAAALTHFKKLDSHTNAFLEAIKHTNTRVIITADHGLVNTGKRRTVNISRHPRLARILEVPLCGDKRNVYCYVAPHNRTEFEKYVNTRLKKHCHLFKSRDLIKKGFFGPFKPHEKLRARTGDYILAMKDNYAIKDCINGEDDRYHNADHGGLSRDEMLVPLIVI
ncbi:alkaline phosphatase family protein [Elusimicrobiota bacterium]